MAQPAGYIRGQVISLTVLDFGLFQVHANGRIIGIPGFLIRTDAGENILVDSGFPPAYAVDAVAASAVDGLDSFGVVLELTARNLPTAQLALCGLTPADIDLLILTHSHIDHVGGLGDFPGVPILRSAPEAALPSPLYFWRQTAHRMARGDLSDHRQGYPDRSRLAAVVLPWSCGRATGALG